MGKLLNDLKCTLIQKAVYAKLYKGHRPNEWEPWHTPEVKKLPSGMICRSDVKYGCTFTAAASSSATSTPVTRCRPAEAVWESWKRS